MPLNFLPILRAVTLKGGVGGSDDDVADVNGQESWALSTEQKKPVVVEEQHRDGRGKLSPDSCRWTASTGSILALLFHDK